MWLEPTAAHCSTTDRKRSNAPSIRPAANSTVSSINPSAKPQITHESLGRDNILGGVFTVGVVEFSRWLWKRRRHRQFRTVVGLRFEEVSLTLSRLIPPSGTVFGLA